MKAVLIAAGLSSDLLRWFWQSPMESVCAGMPRPSWNIIDVHRQTFVFALFGSGATNSLTACGGGYF